MTPVDAGISNAYTIDEKPQVVIDLSFLKANIKPVEVSLKVQESINKHMSVESPKPKLTSKAPVSTEKQIVQAPKPVLITAPQCPESLQSC